MGARRRKQNKLLEQREQENLAAQPQAQAQASGVREMDPAEIPAMTAQCRLCREFVSSNIIAPSVKVKTQALGTEMQRHFEKYHSEFIAMVGIMVGEFAGFMLTNQFIVSDKEEEVKEVWETLRDNLYEIIAQNDPENDDEDGDDDEDDDEDEDEEEIPELEPGVIELPVSEQPSELLAELPATIPSSD